MEEVTKKVIEELISEKEEPCISVYMPTRAAASVEVKQMSIQLKNLLSSVKKDLLDKRYLQYPGSRDIDALLKPATDLLGDMAFWQNQKEGLAIFLNSENFHYYRLNKSVPESFLVSKYVNVMPLIPEVLLNNVYYVLALSKNKNRIFSGIGSHIEQLEIEGMPESKKVISQNTGSEKSISRHIAGSKGAGTIFHGAGEIAAEQKEDLLTYFRQIDQALNKYLDKKEKSPLIVMSVKDIFAMYSEINSYPYLLKESIEGNPDETPPDIIAKSAFPIISKYFDNQIDGIDETYHNLKGTGKTSTHLEEIVSAAHFSRIEQLLVKNNVSQNGIFDPDENKVSIESEGEDHYNLYNFAAIRTIANGGQVYVLDEEKMPDNENVIAFYRF
ncbi:MAG: hypothetical protein GX240_00875 [Candidatus Atribacteria bacterium]|nr:hypothetical protein [Candidatus Atribacteria bacterium]